MPDQRASQEPGVQDLADRLDHMLANLQQFIEQRAAEVAQPLIAKACEAALTDIERAQHKQQRAEDLTAELRRRVGVLERQRTYYRNSVERMRQLIDSYPPGSDFVTSGTARIFRATLDGTSLAKEADRG